MRPTSSCICKYIDPCQTKTRFIILMHPKEYKREKNGTGHMTRLQLANSEIIVGVDFTNNKRVNDILTKEQSASFLLYPGKESFNLSQSTGSQVTSFMSESPYLFLLDGTWPCARKMLKLSKNLQGLQRVSFDNKIKSKFVFKQQPDARCLSTIESVYAVLNLFNKAGLEQCETQDFLVPFEKMMEHQLAYILNPNNRRYSSNASGKITPKNKYKNNPRRTIFFEHSA